MVAVSNDLSKEHLKELRRRAAHWESIDHMDRICYGAKWWQSDERKLVELKQSVQIWASKGLRLKPIPRDLEDKILRRWEPRRKSSSTWQGILQLCPAVDIGRTGSEWWRQMVRFGRPGGSEPLGRRRWRMGGESLVVAE